MINLAIQDITSLHRVLIKVNVIHWRRIYTTIISFKEVREWKLSFNWLLIEKIHLSIKKYQMQIPQTTCLVVSSLGKTYMWT